MSLLNDDHIWVYSPNGTKFCKLCQCTYLGFGYKTKCPLAHLKQSNNNSNDSTDSST